MKTLTQPADAARHTTIPALRRILALAVAPAIALAACSGEAPLTADPTTPAASAESTEPTGTSTTTPGATTTTSEAGTATPQPSRTDKALKLTLTDPILGHSVQILTLTRNLPWPGDHPVAASTFEIVGVRVVATTGTRYSIGFAPSQFRLVAGTTAVAPTTEFGDGYATLLKAIPTNKSGTGWLLFKIDRGTTPTALQILRPAYHVSTTDKDIPAATLSINLPK